MAPNIQYRVKICEVIDQNSSLRERERGFANAFQQTEWLALLELQQQPGEILMKTKAAPNSNPRQLAISTTC